MMTIGCGRLRYRSGYVLALALLVSACSGAPPSILESELRPAIVMDRTRDLIHAELSLFLNVRDADGPEDLEAVYLVHDDSELYWWIPADEWVVEERDGQRWIGAIELVTGDYGLPPNGTYRVLLLDAAGERDESDVFLSADLPPMDRVQFPDISMDAGTIRLESPYPRNDLWLYAETGELIAAVPDVKPGSDLSELIDRQGNGPAPVTFFIRSPADGGAYDVIAGPFFPE